MDIDNTVFDVASVASLHQLLTAYSIWLVNVPTASEVRMAKEHVNELSHYKKNLSVRYGRLMTNLELLQVLERILSDMNRPYIWDVTHLYTWQFFLLVNQLEHFIR